MKMDFPQVDLPTEVLAWTNVTEDILNIYKQSCRLQACIVAICTEGSMKASINLLDYEIHPNDLITLLPGTIIQFRERTEKVCLCFAGFSAHCAGRINLIHQPSLYGVALAKLLFMRRNLLLNGRGICRKRGIMYGKMEKKKGTQGGIAALDSNNHCRFRIIMPIHCLLP